MSIARTGRRSRVAAALGAGVLAAAMSTALMPTPAQAAVLTGTITVATPANAKLAADTAKQVVVLNISGTGAPTLSEDNVASVGLGATPCDALITYVVTSATSITVKTPTGGCPAAASAQSIVITMTNGDTLTKASAITFVSPPRVTATAASKPVINENSAALLPANQQQRFLTSGGQIVRVKAASDFAFDPRTTASLAATLGGKVGTDFKVYAADGTTLMAPGTATDATVAAQVGNFMTFRTTAAMDDSNDTISITQNGVSKSFLTADTGVNVAAGPAITTMSVDSGRSSGGTVVQITGTNFNKTATYGTDVEVYFCGIEAASYGTTVPVVPAINTAGTIITVVTPDVTASASGVGATAYSGTCPVTVREGSWISPLNANTAFSFLSE